MSVLGRTRLPLVMSLLLAAILGCPASTGPAAEALPVPVTATVAAAPVAPAPSPVVVEEIVTAPPAAPAVPAEPVLITAPLLTDQVSTAAVAPRAPPATA